MKLLHTSDWHLGMLLRGGSSYGKDQEYALDQICGILTEEKIDGVLLAGDVFDKGIASQEALRIYDAIMTRICAECGAKVYLIAGNHDGAERISQCSALLEKSGLFIAGALTQQVQVVRGEDADIFLLPWISTDKVKTVYPKEAESINSMEDAYRVVLAHYREQFREGHKNILVAHAYIANTETSVSDRAAEVGRATMVSASVFEGFDYVALGHLHGPQDVNAAIRYSGSLMAYSFGKEEKQIKSVTVLDTRDLSRKIILIRPLHKRTTLTGTYEELMRADMDEEIKKGYVRLEVTDSFVGLEAISLFRDRYQNLLEISGKGFEREDGKITMTVEQFEEENHDPVKVFSHYCQDIQEQMPGAHRLELFQNALRRYEREVTEG